MVENVLRFLPQKYKLELSFFTELYKIKVQKVKLGEGKVPINSLLLTDGTLLLDEYSFEGKRCRFRNCKEESGDARSRYNLERQVRVQDSTESDGNGECVCKFVEGTLVITETLAELRKYDKHGLILDMLDADTVNRNKGVFPSHISENPDESATKLFYKINHFCFFSFVDLKKCSCHYYIANPVVTTKNPFCYSYFGVVENMSYTQDYNNFKLSDLNSILIHFKSNRLEDQFFVYSKNHSRVFNLNELLLEDGEAYINDEQTPLESIYLCSHSSFDEGNELPWAWRNFLVSFCKSNGLYSKDLNLVLVNTNLFESENVTSQAAIYCVQTPSEEDFNSLSVVKGFKHFVSEKDVVYEHYYSFLEGLDSKSLNKVVEELNLELITWRILPDLKLNLITDLKVCVVGVGTLGCSIVRQLLAWGVSKFVLVDRGYVTNATRQSLYVHEDCHQNVPKVDSAERMIVKIRPDSKVTIVNMEIPMPGHNYSQEELSELIINTSSIVDSSDVMILATDSKESRWLPSLMAAQRNHDKEEGPLVISAGLGFDSCMIVRHSYGAFKGACYFCSDSEPLRDTITGRPFDEMCTIVKSGITDICASMTVELLVSLTQHPKKFGSDHGEKTCIGSTPHSIRFSLSDYKCSQLYAEPSDMCLCCSENVVTRLKEYEEISKVIKDPKVLLKHSNLDSMVEKLESYSKKEEVEGDFVVL